MAGKGNTAVHSIRLEGERQYKQAMAEITRALKENRSAVKAAAEEYETQADSWAAQAALGMSLRNQYDQQSEALSLMDEHLAKTEEAYGKNSREAVDLRIKINNLRAEMARTQRQTREFEQSLENTADAAQDTGGAVQDAAQGMAQIGASAGEAQGQAQGLLGQLQSITGIKMGTLLKGGLAAGAGFAIDVGLDIGTDIQESWSQIEASTGATGENLEAIKDAVWDVGAKGAGSGLDDISQTVSEVYRLTGLTGQALSDTSYFALGLRDTFGIDVRESLSAANALMEQFGVDSGTAYDLIATGAQRGANKNGDLVEVIAEYAPYFAAAGKDADEFIGVLVDGAQDGIFSVDKIGDAWKEFMVRLGDDEGAKEALAELGFAADDVTRKIAQGGPAADLATGMIITALASVEDEYERNRLGTALFGTQWEDTAGQILPLFEDMDRGLGDVTGTAERLADVQYSDLDSAMSGLKSRLMELAEPVLLEGVNALIGGLNTIGGILDAFSEGGFDAGMAAIGEATGSFSEAEKQAMEEATGGLQDQMLALNEQINAAFAAGDNVTAWTLEAQRQQLVNAIGTMKEEAVDAVNGVGEGMEAEMAATDMSTAGQTAAQTAVDGVDEKQPEMLDAGDELGGAGVIGAQAGLEGMYNAGVGGADGAVSGLETGIDKAAEAGRKTAAAYNRAFRKELDINSPSRVMYESAGYAVEGVALALDEGESEVYARGAALAGALREGYAGGTVSGADGAASGPDAWDRDLPAAIAEAVREAVSRLELVADGERLGRVTARGVSREIGRSAQTSLAGRIASAKGW